MSYTINWEDAPDGCTHRLQHDVDWRHSPWLRVVSNSAKSLEVYFWLWGGWVAYTDPINNQHCKPANWIARPVAPKQEVVTTGIEACRDAVKKGFRVQCLQGLGKWYYHPSPAFDCEDSNYRVHPDDVPKYIAWYNGEYIEPVTPPKPITNPRPHAELIKAWADGASIQWYGPATGVWVDVPKPSWTPEDSYRIKPEAPSVTKIPRAVFEKSVARSAARRTARRDKILMQIRVLEDQLATINKQLLLKRQRAMAFAKGHVE